jgi:hypothetical protein
MFSHRVTSALIDVRVAETVVQIPIERATIRRVVPITANERRNQTGRKRVFNPYEYYLIFKN